jgi:hypothetical protein
MSKIEFFNVIEFERFQAKWEALGWRVLTPFDATNKVWMENIGRPFDPRKDVCGHGHPLMKKMFALDIQMVLEADAVAFLPGWERSYGSRIESDVASLQRVPMFNAEDSVAAVDFEA